ncbi:hypothetical protein BC831DRAFT_443147 [Entophlyctis helioformis]|nr:hypothetical protein BC831DRAFT_443147 [Entophlyctis helioformis]
MSHQTGIRPSPELVALFTESLALRGSAVRAIHARISPEAANVLAAASSWESDLALIAPWLDPTAPAYILFRKDAPVSDTATDTAWVPDTAKVRDKMLYAASKATLAKELGDSNIADTVYATLPDDLSLDGYRKHMVHVASEGPLTAREVELAQIKTAETGADIGTSSRRANAPGVSFPFGPDATDALGRLKAGDINLVALKIDAATETIGLDVGTTVEWAQVSGAVDHAVPRFLFYAVDAGEHVFAYVCPPSAKVKERMWYSAARAFAISEAETLLGGPLKAKFELDSPAEFVPELVGPEAAAAARSATLGSKTAFAKPARPGRR